MTRIKKYGNRRLYDTSSSSYITLDKLAEKIRGGEQVQVVDAKSGEDLTQVTLAQMVLEGPSAKLLPAALLHQLIRLQDDDFAEFFGRYVTWALDVYLLARAGGSAAASGFPFPMGPFAPFGAPTGGPQPPNASDELERLRKRLVRLEKRMARGDD